MKIHSTVIVSLAALTVGAALMTAPAFAQSHHSALKTGSAANSAKVYGRQHGYGPLYNYVPTPTPSTSSIDDPALMGGGSVGGNALLEVGHRW